MARRLLALDLGAHTLKAVLLECTLRGCRILGFLRRRRDPNQPLAEQIQALCTGHGRHNLTVLSCLPGDAILYRVLTLPFTRQRQLSQVVPFELDSHLPVAQEEVVIDFQVIGRTSTGTTVLAVAVPKPVLRGHLELLQAAGLDPAVVGLAPLAPLSLLRLAHKGQAGSVVVLDIGEQHTAVVLLRDGVFRGFRTLSLGLSREGGFDTLVRELRWTLLALNGKDSVLPSCFFLAGGGAYLPQVQEELARVLAAAVYPLHELVLPAVPPAYRREQAAFAVSLGLGLREALRVAVPALNLRRGEFARQSVQEGARQEIARLGWTAAGVAAAAGLAVTLELYRLHARAQLLQQEIRRVFTLTLPEVRTLVNEKAQLQEAVETLQRQRRLLGGTETVSPLEILRQLSVAIPERVSLDLDEWVCDETVVRMRGTTDSFDTAETIKQAVATLGVFREVQLKDVKTVAAGKKVSFALQLVYDHAPHTR
ncbi:MAG: pilus assembly protein PilM [Candidatus Binatia bacterium]|nr:pilus assembly protein PilM [Candidatus Binatia bacterium]